MSRLALSHAVLSGTVLITVVGDLDASTAPELEAYIEEVRRRPSARLVFDLTEMPYMDSTGLRVLVNALVYAREHGGSVGLAALRIRSLRTLELTQLDTSFQVYPSVELALHAALTAGEKRGDDDGTVLPGSG